MHATTTGGIFRLLAKASPKLQRVSRIPIKTFQYPHILLDKNRKPITIAVRSGRKWLKVVRSDGQWREGEA